MLFLSTLQYTPVFLSGVRVLSLTECYTPPHLPGMPSNTAGLWTCFGVSSDSNLVLLWCVLAPMCTAFRTSTFSFEGALNVLLYIP